jgi:hypothetical protein
MVMSNPVSVFNNETYESAKKARVLFHKVFSNLVYCLTLRLELTHLKHFRGRLLALPTSIRIGWKSMK